MLKTAAGVFGVTPEYLKRLLTEQGKAKKRRHRIQGIGRAAIALGCSREHLQRVLTGQRQSNSLSRRYAELKAHQATATKTVSAIPATKTT